MVQAGYLKYSPSTDGSKLRGWALSEVPVLTLWQSGKASRFTLGGQRFESWTGNSFWPFCTALFQCKFERKYFALGLVGMENTLVISLMGLKNLLMEKTPDGQVHGQWLLEHTSAVRIILLN